jgi:hypothetical protein
MHRGKEREDMWDSLTRSGQSNDCTVKTKQKSLANLLLPVVELASRKPMKLGQHLEDGLDQPVVSTGLNVFVDILLGSRSSLIEYMRG